MLNESEEKIVKTIKDRNYLNMLNISPKDVITAVKLALKEFNELKEIVNEANGDSKSLEDLCRDLKGHNGEFNNKYPLNNYFDVNYKSLLVTITQDIDENSKDMVTIKCTSCGAEVVIDTSETTQARCHWCRNYLSINEQIPNGAVPDVVLPFKLKKDEARQEIEKFVKNRKFYAHPKFKQEFTTENIMGVYLPYMVVDVNSHAYFSGQGEHEKRRYTRGSDDNKRTYYDADLYDVDREFDLTIEGLTVESSSDKINKNSSNKTNNIINSIMPFDIENCVKYNSNYLRGYTSEKRDMDIDDLRQIVDKQSKDVARFAANDTLKQYDRGVRWKTENLNVKGKQWKTAYLPVWLYSYQEKKGDKSILHYVAVNARTKETMGSVPIHMSKLILVSVIVEIIALILMLFVDLDDNGWVFLLAGPLYYGLMYMKYRNKKARHYHEIETKRKIFNLKKSDVFVKTETGLSNSRIEGANNTRVNG